MLMKKILNFLLNVKHTVIDDVKIFDDDSIVFYVHPTKGEQCRCGICCLLYTSDAADDSGTLLVGGGAGWL